MPLREAAPLICPDAGQALQARGQFRSVPRVAVRSKPALATAPSATTSRVMRAIRPVDTVPELILRRALHAIGFRFRLHVSELPGRPDLVFPKYAAVVEVRGCFWHAHSCADGHLPKSNVEFWEAKLQRNRRRDAANVRRLRRLGYRVAIVWECDLRDPGRRSKTVRRIVSWLTALG